MICDRCFNEIAGADGLCAWCRAAAPAPAAAPLIVCTGVRGSCGVEHASIEEWQACQACEQIDRSRRCR